jgi:hypothetical protein
MYHVLHMQPLALVVSHFSCIILVVRLVFLSMEEEQARLSSSHKLQLCGSCMCWAAGCCIKPALGLKGRGALHAGCVVPMGPSLHPCSAVA